MTCEESKSPGEVETVPDAQESVCGHAKSCNIHNLRKSFSTVSVVAIVGMVIATNCPVARRCTLVRRHRMDMPTRDVAYYQCRDLWWGYFKPRCGLVGFPSMLDSHNDFGRDFAHQKCNCSRPHPRLYEWRCFGRITPFCCEQFS